LIQLALFAAALTIAGCGRDKVVATFVWPKATNARLVLFSSGKYELWMLSHGVPTSPYKPFKEYHITIHGIEVTPGGPSPIEVGTYQRNGTTLVKTVDPAWRAPSNSEPSRCYRVVNRDGVEYLFDERGNWAQKYEDTGDTNLLQNAWQQERRQQNK
jgi:hypothetical protein